MFFLRKPREHNSYRSCRFYCKQNRRIFIKSKKEVIGIDSFNDYYDTKVKNYRLKQLKKYKNFL